MSAGIVIVDAILTRWWEEDSAHLFSGVETGEVGRGCYLWKDMEISNLDEGRALNSWLIGLCF